MLKKMGQKKKPSFIVKSELAGELAGSAPLQASEAALAVETVFKEITKALLKGQNVQIRGFGSFEARKYKGYKGRSPRNGQLFYVKAKKIPFFKPAGSFKKELNKKKPSPSRAKA